MIRTERCPVCDSAASRTWPGLVAPFIADRVLDGPVEPCELRQCGGCGLRFFAERFTDPELSRLYADYRGEAYFRTRHKHEPWYTKQFNEDISRRGDIAAARRAGLIEFLSASGVPGPFESILDYGGDAGQLIPQEITAGAYVFDISGLTPVAGVTRIADETALEAGHFRLVLLSHVLEHVPAPVELLRKVRRVVRDDGFLYLEVPMERPWMGLVGRGPLTRGYLNLLRRSGAGLRLVDFYSSGFRLKAGLLPPFGFVKLSEHINFFSAEAVRRALTRSGFEIVRLASASTLGTGHPHDSIACLARAVPA